MSVRIAQWPWLSTGNRLSLALPLDPPFEAAVRTDGDDDDDSVATFALHGQNANRTQTTVRVSNDATVDGQIVPGSVASSVDVGASALVISLPFFKDTLVYDPGTSHHFPPEPLVWCLIHPSGADFGVVLGADARNGGSDTNVLVIAVPVAIAVGSLGVMAAVSACITVAWIRRRRLGRQVGRSVSFDSPSTSDTSSDDIL
ncbi:MAG TPA: hypothetical protein VIO38_12870 [Rariglobus sp.]